MKDINIQTRVFFLALIPTLILSLLLGAYIIVSRIYDLENELRLHGEVILSHIVNMSRHGFLKDKSKTLQDLTSLVLEEKDLETVAFYGPDRNLLAYSGGDAPQLADSLKNTTLNNTGITFVENSDTITLTAPIVVNNLSLIDKFPEEPQAAANKTVIGWASITMSRTKTQLNEYQVILVTIIILTLSILISILLARRTAYRLTYPLFMMRAAVKKLEQGELSTRVNTKSGGEISELEEGINRMAASLQQAQDELQSNIDQATSDLQQSLETIEKKNIELAEAQKEILEGSRIKSEFIANMSHEIRTPMNGIIGFTNLLLETELSTLQRNYLNTIQKSTLNLLNLVNNILDFSRLDAGQLRLEYLSFDLRDCIEDILTIMSPLANAKQLDFAALIDDDVPHKIISDPLRLKQIIINLVSNAIKFTDKGDVIIRVTAEKKTPKFVKLRIEIIDSGIGLQPNDQKSIFKAFQQADTSIARKYGGTGLGLAISKKLIDQMAGKIGLENREQRGSIFWFTFSAENCPINATPDRYESVNFENLTVFLYEPHTITRQAIKNLLTRWHIKTTEFADSNELIKSLNTTAPPAMVIAGISQQQINNNLASITLFQLKQTFAGPTLVLTNSSEQATLEYFLNQGATISLTKPVTRNTLYHTIFQLTNNTVRAPVIVLPDNAHGEIFLTGKTILCVDDNPQNANLISALLQQTQASIVIARDGVEALQIAEKQHFDLILMDIRMPRMDGYETLKHIRTSDSQNVKTPIIALSAHISTDESIELTRAGFNDYLTKPIIKNALLKIIKKWINLHAVEEKPIVDWDLGLRLANNKREIAEEMLWLLMKNLPLEFMDIKNAYDAKNYPELLQRLHKLHGAVCYCGVPRLKDAIASLESSLKKNQHQDIPTLFSKFDFEVKELFKQSAEFIRIYTSTPHSEREKGA
jgi:two-component system sensor histidine kinase BarA